VTVGGIFGTLEWQYPQTPSNICKRVSRFKNPGQVVMIVDGNLQIDLGAPDSFPLLETNGINANMFQISIGRHGGLENYLFVDGHVSAMKLQSLRKAQLNCNNIYTPEAEDYYNF